MRTTVRHGALAAASGCARMHAGAHADARTELPVMIRASECRIGELQASECHAVNRDRPGVGPSPVAIPPPEPAAPH